MIVWDGNIVFMYMLPAFLALTAFGQGLLLALAGWTRVVLAEVLLLAALGAALWLYGVTGAWSLDGWGGLSFWVKLFGSYLGFHAAGAGLGLAFGLVLRRRRHAHGG